MENKALKWNEDFFDWIYTIDEISKKYIFIGTRDGFLKVLRYTARTEICSLNLESWIGTIKVLPVEKEGLTSYYLLVGTKKGRFVCYEFIDEKLYPIFTFHAKNTIREIDFIRDVSIENTWVAFGSEDRHVYYFNFNRLIQAVEIKGDTKDIISKIKTNGWIRSVAFCSNVNDEFLIAAGCGNKYLYFFDLNGVEYDKINVNSKIHSIISDQKTPQLFCVSDSKKFFKITSKIGNKPGRFEIYKKINLLMRSSKIIFRNGRFDQILIVCESSNSQSVVLLYDDCKNYFCRYSFEHKIYTIKDIGEEKDKAFLIGNNLYSLSCYAYSTHLKLKEVDFQSYSLTTDFNSDSLKKFENFSNLFLLGIKVKEEEVGIGRFLHIVEDPEKGIFALVATDEGNFFLFDIKNENLLRLAQNKVEDVRIWSIYGFFEDDILKTYVATSNNQIKKYSAHFTGTNNQNVVFIEEKDSFYIDDWAREIRPISNSDDKNEFIISCENGDVKFFKGEIHFNNNQINRSVFCQKVSNEKYIVLTGSDDNLISFYDIQKRKNGFEIIDEWKFNTIDRVREVIIHENLCIAVSEDRFAYVLTKQGELKWRYQFPHRVLCVDMFINNKADYFFVFGCGDGNVYFLDTDRSISYTYTFPDRIRDLKILNRKYFLVASESSFIYKCNLYDDFIKCYFDDFTTYITKEIEIIALNAEDAVVIDLAKKSLAEKMVLLNYIEYWYSPANIYIAISLIEACRKFYEETPILTTYYIYAKAIVFLTLKIDFNAGITQIREYLRTNNVYIKHSIISTISNYQLAQKHRTDTCSNPKEIIDHIIIHLSLNSNEAWLLDELALHLFNANFFNLNDSGFLSYFKMNRISFKKLEFFLSSCEGSIINDIKKSDLVKLKKILTNFMAKDLNKLKLFKNKLINENTLFLELLTKSDKSLIKEQIINWIKMNIQSKGMSNIITSIVEDTQINSKRFKRNIYNEMINNEEQLNSTDYLNYLFTIAYIQIMV